MSDTTSLIQAVEHDARGVFLTLGDRIYRPTARSSLCERFIVQATVSGDGSVATVCYPSLSPEQWKAEQRIVRAVSNPTTGRLRPRRADSR